MCTNSGIQLTRLDPFRQFGVNSGGRVGGPDFHRGRNLYRYPPGWSQGQAFLEQPNPPSALPPLGFEDWHCFDPFCGPILERLSRNEERGDGDE